LDSIYTTTLTDAARKRGIGVEVLDGELPLFVLSFAGKSVRCYNGLTDRVGAATFHLANDKGAANRFLRARGFPVPRQARYTAYAQAVRFMRETGTIVVKPASQWGGRGVSTHISAERDLRAAIAFARKFCDEIVLEECVTGVDRRLIYVDGKFVAAIQRNPATVKGTGVDTIRTLIKKRNKTACAVDPSNRIPLDRETERSIGSLGLTYETIPADGVTLQVRRTSNYHTGGTVDVITDAVDEELKSLGEKVARAFAIPYLGVDFLVDREKETAVIIEVSPDCAISPPEGEEVAKAFLDMLFPGSRATTAMAFDEPGAGGTSALFRE
jgi:D-alanine-D-alanine ligase-like ATP-grasp enzyme